MTTVAVVLFAADWVEVVVPAVVFIIWIINQIAGAKKAAGPPARPQARPNAPPPANAPAGGQGGLMDEVEQFLRDARKAMEQQQKPQQPRPQPPPQQRPAKPAAKAKPNVRPAKQPRRKEEKPAQRRTLSEQTTLQPQAAGRELDEIHLGGSVAQHVQQHLDTSRFDKRAGQLSSLKQQVESDIGGHVRSVFDHQIGTLQAQAGTRTDAQGAAMTTDDSATGPNSVVQIVAMLRDPQSMRNAIILQEILSPPTHRW